MKQYITKEEVWSLLDKMDRLRKYLKEVKRVTRHTNCSLLMVRQHLGNRYGSMQEERPDRIRRETLEHLELNIKELVPLAERYYIALKNLDMSAYRLTRMEERDLYCDFR